jgi:ABC-type Fe3+-hydroxamate transport system substrate-binding protein
MRKWTRFFTLALCLWLGCAGAAANMRIVSLAPSLTKNLQYMGAEKDLVGCTSYCRPSQKKAVVASAVKVNVEKVISLKPDLVVATTMTSKEQLATLRKFGIKIVVYPTANSFEQICSQFLDLGKQTGRSTQAAQVIRDTRQKVAKLKALPHNRRSIFLQIGANPLFTVIPGTFMNDYITFAGASNIASDLKMGTITRETVLKRNPDIIFIVTMGIVGNAEKSQWEGVQSLNATKNNRIFVLDSDKACTPSPVSFAETLERIVNLSQKP